jgi:hypothetical protein
MTNPSSSPPALLLLLSAGELANNAKENPMPETQYTFRYKDNPTPVRETFNEVEWFAIFITGMVRAKPILWIERSNDSEKRVTFAENADGAESC